ncbi:hypothetical protein HMPREF1581_00642 [Gardnerella vaginalis JCP8108]|uniref:Uncharacterized protein n=1 Tax=Gardnerella vaginalis JCP8108 TaxID=1261066 RepID=S4GHN5_GARVA|nr:hypothetical protein HMPREF1581_00642 [Gardnerella vaginalis JCP8108]
MITLQSYITKLRIIPQNAKQKSGRSKHHTPTYELIKSDARNNHKTRIKNQTIGST